MMINVALGYPEPTPGSSMNITNKFENRETNELEGLA
jgi:hypothetical protein